MSDFWKSVLLFIPHWIPATLNSSSVTSLLLPQDLALRLCPVAWLLYFCGNTLLLFIYKKGCQQTLGVFPPARPCRNLSFCFLPCCSPAVPCSFPNAIFPGVFDSVGTLQAVLHGLGVTAWGEKAPNNTLWYGFLILWLGDLCCTIHILFYLHSM